MAKAFRQASQKRRDKMTDAENKGQRDSRKIASPKTQERWQILYDQLFGLRDAAVRINFISEGLDLIRKNAKRLLDDAKAFSKKERYASARFLLSTADEEMGKWYILVDMIRLHENHEATLKALCKAFYNHVAKYAYRNVSWREEWREFKAVKKKWENEVARWKRLDRAKFKAAIRHPTVYDREWPLYVDVDVDVDAINEPETGKGEGKTAKLGHWGAPENDSYENEFVADSSGFSILTEVSEEFERISDSHRAGLCSCAALRDLNQVFRKEFFGHNTDAKRLRKLYDGLAKKRGVSDYLDTAMAAWPLYYFAEHFPVIGEVPFDFSL